MWVFTEGDTLVEGRFAEQTPQQSKQFGAVPQAAGI